MYQWLSRDVNVKETRKAVTAFVKYRCSVLWQKVEINPEDNETCDSFVQVPVVLMTHFGLHGFEFLEVFRRQIDLQVTDNSIF